MNYITILTIHHRYGAITKELLHFEQEPLPKQMIQALENYATIYGVDTSDIDTKTIDTTKHKRLENEENWADFWNFNK